MVDHDTGEVLAHVGGRDYAQVPYDFIELGKRPLGTAFFPFIYAAGFEHGLTPATLVEDEPMDNRSVMVGGREGILGEWGMEVPSPVYQGKDSRARRRWSTPRSPPPCALPTRSASNGWWISPVRSACRWKMPNCCGALRWASRKCR